MRIEEYCSLHKAWRNLSHSVFSKLWIIWVERLSTLLTRDTRKKLVLAFVSSNGRHLRESSVSQTIETLRLHDRLSGSLSIPNILERTVKLPP